MATINYDHTPQGMKTGRGIIDYTSDFDELFNKTGVSNPFANIHQEDYKLNRRGKLQYQEDMAEAQYLAEMQLMMYQNEYNSPAAQSQRMKEAGLNPDLQGVSGEPAASPAGNVQQPDMAGTSTNIDRALGIVDTTLSIVNAASAGFFTFGMNMENLKGKKLDNNLKLLSSIPGLGDTAYEATMNPASTGDTNAVEDILKSVPRGHMRRRARQYLSHYLGSSTQMRHAYQSLAGENRAKGDYAATETDPRTGGDLSEVMNALKPIQEAEFRIAKIILSANEKQAGQTDAYWSHRDLAGSADMENATDDAAKGEADIQEIVRQGALDSVKKLEKAMEQGKWWAAPALSALYASLSGAMKMPGLSVTGNSNSGVDKAGNPTKTESTAWSFGF